jgi:hypothetical protein
LISQQPAHSQPQAFQELGCVAIFKMFALCSLFLKHYPFHASLDALHGPLIVYRLFDPAGVNFCTVLLVDVCSDVYGCSYAS